MKKQEFELVFDGEAIKGEHGTISHYARKNGADPKVVMAFSTATRQLSAIMPRLISDGFVRIESADAK